MNFKYKKSLSFFLLAVAAVFVFSIFSKNDVVLAQNSPEKDAELRAELAEIEKDIQAQQAILKTKQGEGTSISRDIAILNAKIKEAQLKIRKHNLAIDNLGKDIVVRSGNIEKLDHRIESGKESLGQIIRKTNELDNFTLPEVVLSNQNLSEFFADLDDFNSVKESMKATFNDIREAKQANEVEKETLSVKRNVEIDTRINVEQEKKSIERNEAEKKRLLALNKAEQASYATVIANKSARAAQIRAALFNLRDAAAIPFGTALQYAKVASAKTGIRPAFLLAIITQESNLGANVGSCYLTNYTTGAGIRISSGATVSNLMKPSRDVAPFLEITKEVGRDPLKTRVSCPLSTGYGGAMGPAQFIPSTWQISKGRLAGILGVAVADPWNAEHAFMASALYLSDLGATYGSYTAERNAACKYYSGRVCGSANNTFYGNQVLAKATSIQADIDVLDGN
jgi:membrane-bound lytic murein transglycosylase B